MQNGVFPDEIQLCSEVLPSNTRSQDVRPSRGPVSAAQYTPQQDVRLERFREEAEKAPARNGQTNLRCTAKSCVSSPWLYWNVLLAGCTKMPSSHDVSAILRPANEPSGGSAPVSPSDQSLQFILPVAVVMLIEDPPTSLRVIVPQRYPLIRAFNLTWPGARTSPPASRRGHAHRRSGAVSSQNVSAVLKLANNPEGGSAPASPSDPSLQFNLNELFRDPRLICGVTYGWKFPPILRPANEPRGGSAQASPSDPSLQFNWVGPEKVEPSIVGVHREQFLTWHMPSRHLLMSQIQKRQDHLDILLQQFWGCCSLPFNGEDWLDVEEQSFGTLTCRIHVVINAWAISVVTQYRILKFVAVNVHETRLLRKPLKHLNLGTYQNLETGSMENTRFRRHCWLVPASHHNFVTATYRKMTSPMGNLCRISRTRANDHENAFRP
ncbi:MAG: hypothetical protein Q9215_005896 [Flavoplaca cf. flavocitrina]